MSKSGICRDFQIKVDQTLYCEVGCLRLWIKKNKSEIILAHLQAEEVDERFSFCEDEVPENAKSTRWAWSDEVITVNFMPILHDRDLVFRSTRPIFLATKERVDFYISPCVKLKISFNSKFITSLPIIQYSETWFGKDPTVGDLCYAVKVRGTIDAQDVLMRKYRFICHLSVLNDSEKPLSIDKLKILTEYLRLYQDEEGFLYSDTLIIKQTGDSVKIAMSKPEQKNKKLRKIYDSRSALQTLFMKAFTVLMEH